MYSKHVPKAHLSQITTHCCWSVTHYPVLVNHVQPFWGAAWFWTKIQVQSLFFWVFSVKGHNSTLGQVGTKRRCDKKPFAYNLYSNNKHQVPMINRLICVVKHIQCGAYNLFIQWVAVINTRTIVQNCANEEQHQFSPVDKFDRQKKLRELISNLSHRAEKKKRPIW